MKQTKYTAFQKIMIVIVPIIVFLLILAIVMCAAFTFLPMRVGQILGVGNVTIVMGIVSSVLAVFAIICSIIAKDADEKEEI